MTVSSSGEVGIGTTSPGALLDVSAGGYTTAQTHAIKIGANIGANTARGDGTRKIGSMVGAHYDNDADDITILRLDSENITQQILSIGGTGELNGATMINLYTASSSLATPQTRMTVSSSGEVGIGTTSPDYPLEISKGSGALTLGITNTSSDAAGIALNSGHGNWSIYNSKSTADQLEFRDESAGADRMVIDSAGNVGIGQSPFDASTRLTVKTDGTNDWGILVTDGIDEPSVGLFVNGSGAGEVRAYKNNKSDVGLRLTAEDNADSYFNNGGNIGIGTTAPATLLDIEKAATTGAVPLPMITLSVADGGVDLAAGEGPAIDFYVADGDGTGGISNYLSSRIASVREEAVDTGTDCSLAFWCGSNNSAAEERMRINSAGNVGIGTTAPAHPLTVSSAGEIKALFENTSTTGGQYAYIDVESNAASTSKAYLRLITPDGTSTIHSEGTATAITLKDGNVGIGTASPGTLLECASDGNVYLTLNCDASGAGADNAGVLLEEAGTNVWAIRHNGGSSNRLEILDAGFDDGVIMAQGGTGFSDVSDERVKTDLVTISDAVDKINSLRAVNFKWKYGSEDRRAKNNIGLIAQDVYKVLPEAVTVPEGDYEVTDHPIIEGEKQAQNTWAIDKSKLVPLLIKAVQELSAKVETLENA
jgi:hypothetical protein